MGNFWWVEGVTRPAQNKLHTDLRYTGVSVNIQIANRLPECDHRGQSSTESSSSRMQGDS